MWSRSTDRGDAPDVRSSPVIAWATPSSGCTSATPSSSPTAPHVPAQRRDGALGRGAAGTGGPGSLRRGSRARHPVRRPPPLGWAWVRTRSRSSAAGLAHLASTRRRPYQPGRRRPRPAVRCGPHALDQLRHGPRERWRLREIPPPALDLRSRWSRDARANGSIATDEALARFDELTAEPATARFAATTIPSGEEAQAPGATERRDRQRRPPGGRDRRTRRRRARAPRTPTTRRPCTIPPAPRTTGGQRLPAPVLSSEPRTLRTRASRWRPSATRSCSAGCHGQRAGVPDGRVRCRCLRARADRSDRGQRTRAGQADRDLRRRPAERRRRPLVRALRRAPPRRPRAHPRRDDGALGRGVAGTTRARSLRRGDRARHRVRGPPPARVAVRARSRGTGAAAPHLARSLGRHRDAHRRNPRPAIRRAPRAVDELRHRCGSVAARTSGISSCSGSLEPMASWLATKSSTAEHETEALARFDELTAEPAAARRAAAPSRAAEKRERRVRPNAATANAARLEAAVRRARRRRVRHHVHRRRGGHAPYHRHGVRAAWSACQLQRYVQGRGSHARQSRWRPSVTRSRCPERR